MSLTTCDGDGWDLASRSFELPNKDSDLQPCFDSHIVGYLPENGGLCRLWGCFEPEFLIGR